MKLTFDEVKDIYKKNNYVFFEDGKYNLNLFAIRTNEKIANKFDDFVCIAYKDENNNKIVKIYEATTDPGTYYLNNPMNVNGTAILKPGQYRKSHIIGLHQNKYEALVQRGNLTLYRDNNKDNILDFNENNTITGKDFGINIHRATANEGGQSTQVDK